MDGSANLVFVAPVPASVCAAVEEELIWWHREVFVYNNVGRKQAPSRRLELRHGGDAPRFEKAAV